MEEGREILINHSLYNQILLKGRYEDDNLFGYSIIPIELQYIEEKRKDPEISIDMLERFSKNLAIITNHTRLSLGFADIGNVLDNEEFVEEYLDKRSNPFKLAAVTVIESLFKCDWIDANDLMDQFQTFYGETPFNKKC